MRTRITLVCGTLAVLCAGFIASPALKAADTDSAQVTKMLNETRIMANQLATDAVFMKSFSVNTNVTWETQVTTVNKVKDHINELGRQVAKLKAAEAEASPWQVALIERINPYLTEMVGYTEAVIEHLYKAPQHNFAEYKDYLEANADYATDLATMIGDFVNYGGAKQRVEHLGSKLEIEK